MRAALTRLWQFLPPAQRLRFVLLVAMMAVGALLESLGIGALLPVIGVMQSPELIATNPRLAQLSALVGNPPAQQFFLLMLVALLGFFVLKNAYLVLLDVLQYRYTSGVHARISTSLIGAYLRRPYSFHTQVNTAQLIRNVTIEIDNIFYYSLVPMLQLVSESLVILALFALVVAIDPDAALVLSATAALLVLVFYSLFRERMAQIGRQLQENSGKMIQYAQEGLGGVKEIKVMGRESFFDRAFSAHASIYARALRRALVVNGFPVRLLETVFVAIFVGLLVFLVWSGRAATAVPLLGVYAAAAFRLMPSLSRVMTASNRIRQSSASLRLVMSELETAQWTGPDSGWQGEPMAFAREIRIRDLHYRYPNSEADALRGVDLAIARGEMVGFVGRSGSGKTTLMDCVLGLLEPTAGEILVDGQPIRGHLPAWRSLIGYIPQDIYLTDDSLRKNVALGLEDAQIDDARVWRALEAAQLAGFVRELPGGLDASIGERGVRLSGGQRQRIGIARAMYGDPPVLILDEATSALDTETERAIVHTISGLKGSKTVLVIAHRLSTIQDCDRVYVLERGALVDASRFEGEPELQRE